ncbi:transglutaminase-like domain-containing protein [Nocardioides nitrophenolicus]|uniref:transglutaminase-like domain-containing protein n=1 Tax=Nocardioides nitrophenolicus TaxID=60489 RepID=UPI0027DD5409|nr:transglutaminase family protein [Nocardioides nitrophenolicus]MBM7517302.1 transglutaminase-like putative cysteine protease [Nocardioides nitrophenolicus]
MELIAGPPAAYLAADDVVEATAPEVVALASRLGAGVLDDASFAAAAFAWVRDEIAHAGDAGDPRFAVTATEVLADGVGWCYAKAHLLAAVLRAGGVPTGLCYQRLADGPGHVLHGLVAVHLDGDWHRQDPRGNKPGVAAEFALGEERLAWPVDPALGEADLPQVHVVPAAGVVAALRRGELAVEP